MFMEKKSKKKRKFLKNLAIGLVSIFSCFSLSGCIGAMGGSGSISGGGSGTVKPPPEFENPYEGEADKSVQDYNDVLLGAIGVYETANDAKVFYDNYKGELVDFNTLIDRQFSALATTIWGSLNYAYGSGSYESTISGFGGEKTFSPSSLISSTIYNETGTLKYSNAISGGYKLIETEIKTEVKDEEGNTVYDENGEIVYSISYEYAYSDSVIVPDRAWKKNGITKSEIVGALKYIYKNPFKLSSIPNNFYIVSSTDSNTNLQQLKNHYLSFNSSLNSNDTISTIGFSEEFMWNVLYYVAFTIIGETNINNSIDTASTVFNGSMINTVAHENFESFEKYKGYEKILPEIVSNAFKMQISGSSIIVGSEYCFNIDNYNSFYDKTIFSIMERYEYIFFDDVNDICDAEETSFEFDDDYDFDNPKSEEELENETIKVGTLRKIKKIILIPKIDKTKYNYETFVVENLSLCFTTETGELELEILTNLVDETGKEYKDKQLQFDDGSFSVDMGDGTTVSGSGSDEMVTKDGHLIVQSTPSINKYGNIASIFDSEKESEGYKFSSISDTARITNSFQSTSYDVATTGEKINIGRIKVCNQLFKMQAVDTSTNANGVLSAIQVDKNDTNIIEFDFKYYVKNGSEMTYIPKLYLLDFSLS